mgnify:CR=1 FL=1
MITYKDAGVDVERGYEAVRRMKQHVAATFDENVLGGLGSFGGFYSIENENVEKPVLVAGTDGVGTKLKLAFLMDKHDTVGIDCVAMCVNDVVCQGAKPLIFLDYIATGYLDPVKVEQIVAGVADGCRQAGCALIGGETAEMPDFYPEGEYDLAGFTVGLVGREKSISGERVAGGDVLVGMASSGVHSNGYSLVRKLVLTADRDLNAPVEAFGGKSWGETLLSDDDLDPETRRKGMQVIMGETERLSQMVEELLDFSRIQGGRMVLTRENVDLAAELSDVVLMYTERARRENKTLLYEEPEGVIIVYADRNRLRQVFINILDNAIKYSDGGDTVAVTLTTISGSAVISVADTGIGIAPEHQSRIFERFYRVDKSHSKASGGTGLGLSIVKHAVAYHHGTVQLESQPGKGTTITVTIPKKQS